MNKERRKRKIQTHKLTKRKRASRGFGKSEVKDIYKQNTKSKGEREERIKYLKRKIPNTRTERERDKIYFLIFFFFFGLS